MSDSRMFSPAYADARAAATPSYAALLGQVMFLVALAIGFLALGSYVGRDLSFHTARLLSFAGFGMLIASSFVPVLRRGPVAITWLFATALMVGLGLAPVLAYFVDHDPAAVTQAAAATGLVVLGMAAAGTFTAKDLAPFMRPLSLVVLGLVLVSFVMVLFASGGNPILSAIIGIVSAALIAVDFNYLRRHATEDDVVWLATGIFVSIVNIFLSLLNIFGR